MLSFCNFVKYFGSDLLGAVSSSSRVWAIRHSVKPAWCCVSSCSMVSDIRSSAGLYAAPPAALSLHTRLPLGAVCPSKPVCHYDLVCLFSGHFCSSVVISVRPLCLHICLPAIIFLLFFVFHLYIACLCASL